MKVVLAKQRELATFPSTRDRVRVYLGQEFALLEAGYLVVRILQKYPSMRVPADEAVEAIGEETQKLTLVLAPAGGCRVQLA